MRKLIAATVGLAAALVLAGCGGDDDNGDAGSAISKADFIAQANQICETGNAELASTFASIDPNSSPEELQQMVISTVIPNIRGQLSDIRALGFPEGDEATLDSIFDQAGQVLDEAEANPAVMLDESADEFADVNTKLNDYGLTTCGASDAG